MKRFVASALAALMLLTVFASAAMADDNNTTSAASTVEIRGPVYNGSSLTDILANSAYGNGTAITMDANKFAAFYYDIDDNVTTESLTIKNVAGTSGRTIGDNGLVYKTTIGNAEYKYDDWGNYSVIGFFADKYIPLKSNSADKLAKLVLDSDDKYTLKTGDSLDLGDGYSLQAKQVDVDGNKVWLEFDKDGEYVDDEIVSTDTGDHIWTCKVDDVQGEDDVPVLKVHVNQVFQGAVDSIAQIDGLWLIDYANARKIESDDEFGKLNDVSLNGASINISNDDTFSLTKDSDQEIGEGMYFKIADSNDLRYYPYVEQTIGNGTTTTTLSNTSIDNTTATDNMSVTTPVVNNTDETQDVNTTPTNTEPVTTTSATPDAANNTTATKNKSPGFGAIPAVCGLLLVVYIVRKNR